MTGTDEQWPSCLADYIRHSDEALLKASEKLLSLYTDEYLPCSSFSEFCDVAGGLFVLIMNIYVVISILYCISGLLDVITDPETYISDLLKGM